MVKKSSKSDDQEHKLSPAGQARLDKIVDKHLEYLEMFYKEKTSKKKRKIKKKKELPKQKKSPKKINYGFVICGFEGCNRKFKRKCGIHRLCPKHSPVYVPKKPKKRKKYERWSEK